VTGIGLARPRKRERDLPPSRRAWPVHFKEQTVGKYVIGWLVGVPVIVLVAIWLLF